MQTSPPDDAAGRARAASLAAPAGMSDDIAEAMESDTGETAVLERPFPDPTDSSSGALRPCAMHAGPDDLTQLDLPPPPALSWHLAPAGPVYNDGAARAIAESERRQRSKPALIAADSWGETSLAFNANTAAGMSYVFGWISGLLVYFNERENRFVRFHALQSVLFSAVSVAFGVLVSIFAAIFFDLGRVTHSITLAVLGWVLAVCAVFAVVVVWAWLMVAAWTGHRAQIPVPLVGSIVRHYAERYAAPPLQQPIR